MLNEQEMDWVRDQLRGLGRPSAQQAADKLIAAYEALRLKWFIGEAAHQIITDCYPPDGPR